MITSLPDEVIHKVLLYTDPCWAYSLRKTSKFFWEYVDEFYKRNAGTLVKSGGEWHHCIKSKRTRASLQLPGQIISYAPMGVHSILHQKCAECKRPFKAAIHKDFGIIAHSECIRPYLLNLYYLEKIGLQVGHFENVPQCQLKGYYCTYGDHGEYRYITVWKDKTNGIVPYSWTAHYVVHSQYQEHVKDYLKEKERIRIENEKEKKERPRRVRILYKERIEKVVEIMSHSQSLTKKQIKNVIETGLPYKFLQNFFGKRDVPHTAFSNHDYEKAVYVVFNIHRLLEYMTPREISSLSYFNLKDRQR